MISKTYRNMSNTRLLTRSCAKRLQLSVPKTCDIAINNQIAKEYAASYLYDDMYAFYSNSDIGLYGFSNFAEKNSKEEREHAQELIDYLNKRGGKVHIKRTKCLIPFKPQSDHLIAVAKHGLDVSIQAEQSNYDALLNLYYIADEAGDVCLTDFVQNMLNHQVDAIHKQHHLNLQFSHLTDNGLMGLYYFDELLNKL